MLFGARTEKTRTLPADDPQGPTSPSVAEGDAASPAAGVGDKPKRKGHGRNGAARYRGAERVLVPHASLRAGDRCPACHEGRLYELRTPAVLVRLRGQAPIAATVYELQRLRCSPCGAVIEASAPAGVGEDKYDETVPAMLSVLRFGNGAPHTRLDRLQSSVGVPLPASTQWEIIHRAVNIAFNVACAELIREAAQGELVHNDDTSARILARMAERRRRAAGARAADGRQPAVESDGPSAARVGTFTTGIVSRARRAPHRAVFHRCAACGRKSEGPTRQALFRAARLPSRCATRSSATCRRSSERLWRIALRTEGAIRRDLRSLPGRNAAT